MNDCPKCRAGSIIWDEMLGNYTCDHCGFLPVSFRPGRFVSYHYTKPLGSLISPSQSEFFRRLMKLQNTIAKEEHHKRAEAARDEWVEKYAPVIIGDWKEQYKEGMTELEEGNIIWGIAGRYHVSVKFVITRLKEKGVADISDWLIYHYNIYLKHGKRIEAEWNSRAAELKEDWEKRTGKGTKGSVATYLLIAKIAKGLRLEYDQVAIVLNLLGVCLSGRLARRIVEKIGEIGQVVVWMWNGGVENCKNDYSKGKLIEDIARSIEEKSSWVASVLRETGTYADAVNICLVYNVSKKVLILLRRGPMTVREMRKKLNLQHSTVWRACNMLAEVGLVRRSSEEVFSKDARRGEYVYYRPEQEKDIKFFILQHSVRYPAYLLIKEQPRTREELNQLLPTTNRPVQEYLKNLLKEGWIKQTKVKLVLVYYCQGDERKAFLRSLKASREMWQLIQALQQGEKSMGTLRAEFNLSRTALDWRLEYLRKQGIAKSERRVRSPHYMGASIMHWSLTPEFMEELKKNSWLM